MPQSIFKITILLFCLILTSIEVNCVNQSEFEGYKVDNNGPQEKRPTLLPPTRLGAPIQPIRGEHISLKFYESIRKTDKGKKHLQAVLHNFLENLQKNLTTSSVLNTLVNITESSQNRHQLKKAIDLMGFFRAASGAAALFSKECENLFEIMKNESDSLLMKLRQAPAGHLHLSMTIKSQLTDYFAEMEFFHVMLCEVIDQALEFIVNTMLTLERTFSRYSDIQNDLLFNSNFKWENELCCNWYMDFLHHWSVQIYQCAINTKLSTAYDVYAITEVTMSYLLQQLEFRIQRIFNCFLSNDSVRFDIRCRFLKEPEQDFEKLHAKLEEVQIYYDIKIKRGRVSNSRQRRHMRENDFLAIGEMDWRKEDYEVITENKCIPSGFPDVEMASNLKSCLSL